VFDYDSRQLQCLAVSLLDNYFGGLEFFVGLYLHMKKYCLFTIMLLIVGCDNTAQPEALSSHHSEIAANNIELLILENSHVSLAVSPQMGGRVLELSLNGKPNILSVGDAVALNPEPEVTASADNIGYLGHTVWLGPQSEWWKHQQVNSTRRDAAAAWPPDPWLVQSKNTVVGHSERLVEFAGVSSPVSGVQLNKRFSLDPLHPSRVKVAAEVINIRETENVSWDIWFNTRVNAATNVYVPVDGESSLRKQTPFSDSASPLTYAIKDNVFTLLTPPPEAGKNERSGKFFIQPSQGWLAAFNDDQLLIIQFPLLDKSLIHPEQGHIELYMRYTGDKPEQGLLELEVHAAYKTLQPGKRMVAEETWILLPYLGGNDEASRLSFLQREIIRLGALY